MSKPIIKLDPLRYRYEDMERVQIKLEDSGYIVLWEPGYIEPAPAGLSLRDTFAAAALESMGTWICTDVESSALIRGFKSPNDAIFDYLGARCFLAYKTADAMLAASEVKRE